MADGSQIYQMILAAQPGFSDWWRKAEESRLGRLEQQAATEQRRLTIDEMRRKADMERARQQVIGEAMRPTPGYSVPEMGVTQGSDGQPVFPTRPQVPTGPAGLGDVRRTMVAPDLYAPETIAKIGSLFSQRGYDPSALTTGLERAATERDLRQSVIDARKAGTALTNTKTEAAMSADAATDFGAIAKNPGATADDLFAATMKLPKQYQAQAVGAVQQALANGVTVQGIATFLARQNVGKVSEQLGPTKTVDTGDKIIQTSRDPFTGVTTEDAEWERRLSPKQRADLEMGRQRLNFAMSKEAKKDKVVGNPSGLIPIMKAINAGKLPNSILTSRQLPMLSILAAEQPDIFDNFDGKNFGLQLKVLGNIFTKDNDTLVAHNTAKTHLEDFKTMVRAIHENTPIPSAQLMRMQDWLQRQYGITASLRNPDGSFNKEGLRTAARAVGTALSSEVARVVHGSGVVPDALRKEYDAFTDPNDPKVLAATDAIWGVLASRTKTKIEAINQTLASTNFKGKATMNPSGGVSVNKELEGGGAPAAKAVGEISDDDVLRALKGGRK